MVSTNTTVYQSQRRPYYRFIKGDQKDKSKENHQ